MQSERDEKLAADAIFAYEIAKRIRDRSKNYSEVVNTLKLIQQQFDAEREIVRPQLGDCPRDIWNNRIQVPETRIPDTERK